MPAKGARLQYSGILKLHKVSLGFSCSLKEVREQDLKNQWLKMKKGWDFTDKILQKKQQQHNKQKTNTKLNEKTYRFSFHFTVVSFLCWPFDMI